MSTKSKKPAKRVAEGAQKAKPIAFTAQELRLRPLTSRLAGAHLKIGKVITHHAKKSGEIVVRTDDEVSVYNEYAEGGTETTYGPGDTVSSGDQLLCGDPAASGSDIDYVSIVDTNVPIGQDPVTVMEYAVPNNGDPPYVEANMDYFNDYEEYYDEEDDTPVYEGSDCDSGIGIRG